MKKCYVLIVVFLLMATMLTGCKSNNEKLRDLEKKTNKLIDQYDVAEDMVNKLDSDLWGLKSVCLNNLYAKTNNNFGVLEEYLYQDDNFSEEEFKKYFKENIRYETDNFEIQTEEGTNAKIELIKYEDEYQQWLIKQIKKGKLTRDRLLYDYPVIKDDLFKDLSGALKKSKKEAAKIEEEIDDMNIKIMKLEYN